MDFGRVIFVCTSDRKGTPKRTVPYAELRPDHGIVGDAHAGTGHRQVSLLDIGDIRSMEAKLGEGCELEPGAFGENLAIGDIDTRILGVGSRLAIGDATVEITQVGKVCHSRCAIYEQVGDCIMPRHGLFARVLSGGVVGPDAKVSVLSQALRGLPVVTGDA